mgnify:CR=1 FL=1|tara:strand:- start:1127 stop:1405 length:279 start_codon:yes stop_codon:yes gene_type:complete
MTSNIKHIYGLKEKSRAKSRIFAFPDSGTLAIKIHIIDSRYRLTIGAGCLFHLWVAGIGYCYHIYVYIAVGKRRWCSDMKKNVQNFHFERFC